MRDVSSGLFSSPSLHGSDMAAGVSLLLLGVLPSVAAGLLVFAYRQAASTSSDLRLPSSSKMPSRVSNSTSWRAAVRGEPFKRMRDICILYKKSAVAYERSVHDEDKHSKDMAVNSVALLQRRLAAFKSGKAAPHTNAEDGRKGVQEAPSSPESERSRGGASSSSLAVLGNSSSSSTRQRSDILS